MISIIIPAFNEEAGLPELIRYLKSCASSTSIEVIISDGGSSDNTVKYSEEAGALVFESPYKGRAKQMNFGASKAQGDILYFLHADTYPPEKFDSIIEATVSIGFEAGCFRLLFDNPHPLLSFYSWFTRFDIDVFRFGDQSLFVTKSVFEKIKGFDEELIVMEDQVIVKSLKEHTGFRILDASVKTSARKYEQIGYIKLQLIFSSILIMFYLGIDQQKLVSFYLKRIQ